MSNQSIIIICIVICNCEDAIFRNIIKLKNLKKDLSKIETIIFIIEMFKFQKYLNIILVSVNEIARFILIFIII